MTLYTIIANEEHSVEYEMEAASQEEALKRFRNGDQGEYKGGTYSEIKSIEAIVDGDIITCINEAF